MMSLILLIEKGRRGLLGAEGRLLPYYTIRLKRVGVQIA